MNDFSPKWNVSMRTWVGLSSRSGKSHSHWVFLRKKLKRKSHSRYTPPVFICKTRAMLSIVASSLRHNSLPCELSVYTHNDWLQMLLIAHGIYNNRDCVNWINIYLNRDWVWLRYDEIGKMATLNISFYLLKNINKKTETKECLHLRVVPPLFSLILPVPVALLFILLSLSFVWYKLHIYIRVISSSRYLCSFVSFLFLFKNFIRLLSFLFIHARRNTRRETPEMMRVRYSLCAQRLNYDQGQVLAGATLRVRLPLYI